MVIRPLFRSTRYFLQFLFRALVLAVVTLKIFSWATLGFYLSFGLTTALGISAFALILETGSVYHNQHVAWILLHRCFRSPKHIEQFVYGLVKPIHFIIH